MPRTHAAPRLDWAAELLEHHGRLDAATLGAHYHADLGYHAPDERCPHCTLNGAQLLARLIAARRATPLEVVAAPVTTGED